MQTCLSAGGYYKEIATFCSDKLSKLDVFPEWNIYYNWVAGVHTLGDVVYTH